MRRHTAAAGVVLPLVLCAGLGATDSALSALLQASDALLSLIEAVGEIDLNALIPSVRPNVVVLGPHLSGLAEVHRVAQLHPATGVVTIVDEIGRGTLRAYELAGASAVLAADASPRVLISTVIALAARVHIVGSSEMRVDRSWSLTTKEAEILILLDTHLRLPQIADVIGVSVETIRSQTKKLFQNEGLWL